MDNNAKLYVLVHGGGSGPWVWDQVKPYLEAAGHKVVTPDLGVEPDDRLADYRNTVLQSISDARHAVDIITVGWSGMGSTTALLAGAACNARAVVNLAGVVPYPSRPLTDAFADQIYENDLKAVAAVKMPDGSIGYDERARDILFPDVADDVYEVQVSNARVQPGTVQSDIVPLGEWPRIRFISLLGKDDRAIIFDAVARETEKVGGEIIALDCGHTPHLSHAKRTAEILLRI